MKKIFSMFFILHLFGLINVINCQSSNEQVPEIFNWKNFTFYDDTLNALIQNIITTELENCDFTIVYQPPFAHSKSYNSLLQLPFKKQVSSLFLALLIIVIP